MSAGYGTLNSDLERTLLNRFQEHGLLEIGKLAVRVQSGIAYINGCVGSLKQKQLATNLASQIDGIVDVVNMLRVTPVSLLDDEALEEHIRNALNRNPKLNESRITVKVVNGHVYLEGVVTTATEKSIAESEVWAAPGIRGMTNSIKVVCECHKNEHQVIEDIRRTLGDYLGIDTSTIGIDVRHGIVHIYGSVPDEYFVHATEELAMWTPGVKGVINRLQVQDHSGLAQAEHPISSSPERCLQIDTAQPSLL